MIDSLHTLGIDWETAPLAVREQLAVDSDKIPALLQSIHAIAPVAGCVLLQTCNRFEVYVDLQPEADSSALQDGILELLGVSPAVKPELFHLSGADAHRRLFEVACGLHSQILGEEQILTQVRTAIETARAAQTTTPALETLFRIGITAGKAARTQVKLQAVPPSCASKAVELATEAFANLDGKRAVVIGNGEIGRLAADLLVQAGCRVTTTLRSYRHGQTVVPRGCETVAYEKRAAAIDGCQLLVSATRSPHYTVTAAMLEGLTRPPAMVVDMALPRDVEPACRQMPGILFYDMDDLHSGQDALDSPEVAQIRAIVHSHLEDFKKWNAGRNRYAGKAKKKLAILAGTSEGRLLCEHLSKAGVEATAFVATDYGNAVFPALSGIEVLTGRLDAPAMCAALHDFDTVVDATHPYAVEASRNCKQAAETAGVRYLRLLRPPGGTMQNDVVSVSNTAEAVAYLARTEGQILLTTGSKELAAYTAIPDYKQRLHIRVLPDPDVLRRCRELGFAASRTIAMQGPFSHDLNTALLRRSGAAWMVTKDTGRAGGLLQKLSAAEESGTRVLLIARPQEETGHTLEEVCYLLTGAPPSAEAEVVAPVYFPLFVGVTDKPCLVVGGGRVGMRRCKILRDFGADVTAISPAFSDCLAGVEQLQRTFIPGDTEGMALVVAATDDRETNHQIAQECYANRIPVSVADCREECTFYFPAICQSTNLIAGIVSDGKQHHLVAQSAAAIRNLMEEMDR